MPPEAQICHSSENRVRIRIPSKKGEAEYFKSLRDKFLTLKKFEAVEVNPVTGSVLFAGAHADISNIITAGESEGFFSVKKEVEVRPVPVSRRLAQPLQEASAFLTRSSGGLLDLPGLAFILLLGIGAYQVLRGNLRSPPWYTAFWYAFGVFTKSVADMASKDENR
jgi:Heavy metal associated domain 2